MDHLLLMEDFKQLYDALYYHPLFVDHPELLSRFSQLYDSLNDQCTDFNHFINAASILTCFFGDGHTNIEIPYTPNDLCLPIMCNWIDNALVLKKQIYSVNAGARIISIENVSISDITAKMATRIPHENLFLVKSRMVEYPYRNYHLFSDLNLEWMFGRKLNYQITFEYLGKSQTISVPLVPYYGLLDFHDTDPVSLTIRGNTAILRLDACICDDRYVQALEQLSVECSKQSIQSLTLDLSRNMGGTLEVIERFLQYVNIETFHRYEMIDYSTGTPVKICSRTEEIQNKHKAHLFPNKIICKVSKTTFSSARTFAVTLKDNNIATIVGEPTGGKPSSYGMPKRSVLNNTGIRFRVSKALFLRPNASLDEEDALYPILNQ